MEDTRTHKTLVSCPYCSSTLSIQTNPEEYVDSCFVEVCVICSKKFFVEVKLVTKRTEDMFP